MTIPDPTKPLPAGVVFRAGPITAQDYDDAIASLQEAKTQLAPNTDNCHVCGDGMCWAGNCRHNPLVMARLAASRESEWRCFHCNAVFTDPEAAEEHFGKHDEEVARCLCRPPGQVEGITPLEDALDSTIKAGVAAGVLCNDCHHPAHNGLHTFGDEYCSQQVFRDGEWTVCKCCYQGTESPRRCKLHDGGEWRCHLPGGHLGECSTHDDSLVIPVLTRPMSANLSRPSGSAREAADLGKIAEAICAKLLPNNVSPADVMDAEKILLKHLPHFSGQAGGETKEE